ncbi:MAG TPA: HD domain-containing protein [Bryobacteraceae bacterium]|nr:HD domain-containing protein [Bryobacteraceae bacterium]
MKSPYVSELQPNQLVTATLLVQYKDIRQKKTGEPCLTLTLVDRTGEVDARMWDNVAEVMNTFDRDDFVRVRGLMQVHHNRLQMTVHKIQRQSSESVDFSDFFPASERSSDEMWTELLSVAASVQDRHLRTLLDAVLSDPDIAQRLKIAPAAKNVHHAYIGGLLEHVLSMCALAQPVAAHYRNIDLDLLLTGIILHDIGKIYELTYDRSFGYSSEGQLLGHITIGIRILANKFASLPEFPPRLRNLVEHLVLSHHGELAYGSPKVPLFAEALVLHHLDNLDSKVACMKSSLHKDRYVEGCWTGFNAALDRPLLKKEKYLDRGDAPDDPPPPPTADSNPTRVESATIPVAQHRAHSDSQARPQKPGTLFSDKLSAALRRAD